jgi:hypothetical protein
LQHPLLEGLLISESCPSSFIWWSLAVLEIGSLKRLLSYNEVFGVALIQYNRCPYKKKRLGHRQHRGPPYENMAWK